MSSARCNADPAIITDRPALADGFFEVSERRIEVRGERSRPLIDALHAVMVEHRATLSRSNDIATAIDYMLKRWATFTRFLTDGRVASPTTQRNGPCEQ